ncbi:hypothetical protein, partial [Rufibacter ruber]|uniref:hypothetical protein n=1 Tax=Rufibacter ruber TaxID=1783499 RepID=UPI0019D3A999
FFACFLKNRPKNRNRYPPVASALYDFRKYFSHSQNMTCTGQADLPSRHPPLLQPISSFTAFFLFHSNK